MRNVGLENAKKLVSFAESDPTNRTCRLLLAKRVVAL